MPEISNIIDDEALDFVLKDKNHTGSEGSPGQEELTATIRGELSQVNLADIFQTITMSAMQGTLRVNASWEPTYVHFQDGKLRVLPPQELQGRRLGYRLRASGLMDAREIRTAFIKHKREGGELGKILEATGKIEKVQFEAIRLALEEDFLLELFTLRRGAFAFFRESFPLTGLEERLQACQQFETDQILLEIARRSDEWTVILDALGDIDEVFIATGRAVPERRGDLDDELYALIDGQKSLRDIAGGMLDSLFEVAKAAQRLFEKGAIEKAPAHHLMALSRTALASGEQRRAYQYLSLIRENRTTSLDEQEKIADLLVVAGDPKAGAEVLAASARRTEDAERRLQILRQARDLDSLNRDVLELLVEAARDPGAVQQTPEFHEAASRLVEIYIDEADYESALALVEELEGERPNELGLVSKKARILLKMDQREEAFAALSELAKTFRLQKDNANLIKTLEQILRLDPRDAKTRSELNSLLASKGLKRVRRLILVLVAALVLRIAWAVVPDYWAESRGAKLLIEARELVGTGQLEEARRIAGQVAGDLGASEVGSAAVTMVREIEKAIKEAERERRAEVLELLRGEIDAAVSDLQESRFVAALERYEKLLARFARVPEHLATIRSSLHARFRAVQSQLVEQIELVESGSLPANDEAQTPKQRRELRARLDAVFARRRLDALDRFGRKLDGAAKLLPKGFAATTRRYVEVGGRIDAQREKLAALIAEDAAKAALNEPFIKARDAEARHDFREALRQYERLVSGYKGDPETAAVFVARRDHFAAIVRDLDELEAATEKGDYVTAAKHYQRLRASDDSVPFGELVQLPLDLSSAPAGATVLDGGKVVGKTPLLFRYRPADRVQLELRLDGFRTTSVPDEARESGSFAHVFEIEPSWSVELGGALTQPARFDRAENTLIVTDRSGGVWGIDGSQQKVRFHAQLEEVSGDLGIPFVFGGRFVLPARDGTLRCFETPTGHLLWTKKLPERLLSPAVPGGRNAWIASAQGHGYLIALADGERIQEIRHVGPMRQAPVAGPLGRQFYVDREGLVAGVGRDGTELWRRRVDRAGWAPAAIAGTLLLVPGEDGNLTALRCDRGGAVAWRLPLGDVLRHAPLVSGDRAWVTTGARELLEIDLQAGKISRRAKLRARPSGPLSKVGDLLFVPLERRGATAYHVGNLTPFCRLSDGTTTELPVLAAGPRSVVFLASSGELRWYRRSLLQRR